MRWAVEFKGQKEQMAADIRSIMSGGFNGDAAEVASCKGTILGWGLSCILLQFNKKKR